MSPIRIYFEGDKGLRPGFRKFFGENQRLTLVSGGNRPETEKDFLLGEKSHPECLNLLLIDSDVPLTVDARHPQRYFMVQVMESWFLADREALAKYFGKEFNPNVLPGSPAAIEAIPKADVLRDLDDATRKCSKRKYSGGKVVHGRELLGRIDREKVRRASPECDRLFQTLGL